jgi:hypothetical protein
MSWWVGVPTSGTDWYAYSAGSQAAANAVAVKRGDTAEGPFATKAAADEWIAEYDPGTAPTGGSGSSGGKYWVTWKDESNGTAARNSAIIWGPQANPPPQLSGWFLSGSFATKADAEAYKNAIGTGSLAPPSGTPVLGGQKVPNPLSGIDAVGSFFNMLSERGTWVRIAKVVIGAGLIFMGIQQLRVVQKGESVVVNSVGKAAKVAGTAALV